MKAIQYAQLGPPEVLKTVELPDPEPRFGEVVIRINVASLNHGDVHLRRGMPGLKTPLPHIPGLDGAGVIEAVGEGVNSSRIGQRVLINPGLSCEVCDRCLSGKKSVCHRYQVIGREMDGTWAERIAVPERNALAIPDSLSFEHAACLPVVYLTAWNMVVTQAKLHAGQDILIMCAGSGVGMAAIQIAQLIGARVIATVGRAEKLTPAREFFELEDILHYQPDQIEGQVRDLTQGRGADVVIDHVGGDMWLPLLRSLRRGGTLVTCGATAGHGPQTHLREVYRRQLSIRGSVMGNDAELNRVLKLAFEGNLVPKVDGTYPHGGASKCHHRMEVGETFGKLLLTF